MHMQLNDLSMKEFVSAVGGGEPVPGGGSVSALCGALASALAKMVAGLTIGKKKYADVQEEMSALQEKLAESTQLLLDAVELDSQAYEQVFNAYKLPKETDEEKALRSQCIQEKLKYAAEVPMGVAKGVSGILHCIEAVAEKGNQNAITDAYVASLCARTAVLGAGANVRINLTSIKDSQFVEEKKLELEAIEKAAGATERRVAALLQKALE